MLNVCVCVVWPQETNFPSPLMGCKLIHFLLHTHAQNTLGEKQLSWAEEKNLKQNVRFRACFGMNYFEEGGINGMLTGWISASIRPRFITHHRHFRRTESRVMVLKRGHKNLVVLKEGF